MTTESKYVFARARRDRNKASGEIPWRSLERFIGLIGSRNKRESVHDLYFQAAIISGTAVKGVHLLIVLTLALVLTFPRDVSFLINRIICEIISSYIHFRSKQFCQSFFSSTRNLDDIKLHESIEFKGYLRHKARFHLLILIAIEIMYTQYYFVD